MDTVGEGMLREGPTRRSRTIAEARHGLSSGVRIRSRRWRSHTRGAVLLAFLGRRIAET